MLSRWVPFRRSRDGGQLQGMYDRRYTMAALFGVAYDPAGNDADMFLL